LTIDKPAAVDFEPTYRTGIAARLAGIPAETLRVWERRYRVVGPRLSPRGHRLYTAEDVSRLALMKQLVDLGSPIGSVASLSLAALRGMRSAAGAAAHGVAAGPAGSLRAVRVALIGGALVEQAAREGALLSTLEVVASCAGAADAAAALRGVSADILVIELPTLQPGAVANVDELVNAVGARHAVVAYRWGPAAVIRALRNRGHWVVRAPLDPLALEQFCREANGTEAINAPAQSLPLPLDAISERRFDEPSLARLARCLTTLDCECPHHVVELLLGLGAFERYSSECANRSPADAALHQYLQRVAGSARLLFEDALVRIARADGLALPVGAGTADLAARLGKESLPS